MNKWFLIRMHFGKESIICPEKWLCMCVCTHACTYIYTHMHISYIIYMYIHMYIHICVHVCVHVNFILCLVLCTELKQIVGLHESFKTIKFLEKNIEEKWWPWYRLRFLKLDTSQTQSIKEQIDKMNSITTKILWFLKDAIRRKKGKPHTWRKFCKTNIW